MKYKAKKIEKGKNEGKYAVFTGKKYFTNSVTDNKEAAEVDALMRSGHWYNDQVLKIQEKLIELGEVDPGDPRGWLC